MSSSTVTFDGSLISDLSSFKNKKWIVSYIQYFFDPNKFSTWNEGNVSYRNGKPSMYSILIFNNYAKLEKLTKSISVLLIFFECKIHDLNTKHGKKFYLISQFSSHRETFQTIMWLWSCEIFHYLKSSFLFFLFFVSGNFFLTTVGHLADTSAVCFNWTGIFRVPGEILKNTTEDKSKITCSNNLLSP